MVSVGRMATAPHYIILWCQKFQLTLAVA